MFEPLSQSVFDTDGEVEGKVLKFYPTYIQQYQPCAPTQCAFGDMATFAWSVWRILCLEHFEHGEDKSAIL